MNSNEPLSSQPQVYGIASKIETVAELLDFVHMVWQAHEPWEPGIIWLLLHALMGNALEDRDESLYFNDSGLHAMTIALLRSIDVEALHEELARMPLPWRGANCG